MTAFYHPASPGFTGFRIAKGAAMSETKCRRAPRRWRALAGLFSAGLTSILIASARADAPPSRPNIVLILADDLGWADVSWHGQEIQTPRLASLAAAGARLEQ